MNLSDQNTVDRPGPFPSGPIEADSFSAEELALEESILASLVKSQFPSLDVSPGGSFYEGFVRPGALVVAAARKTGIRFRKSMTINGISSSNFSDLDQDAVSSLLSNYLMTIDSGAVASGRISVQLSSNRFVSIPRGAAFSTEDGISFVSTENASASSANLVSDGAGTWTFSVPVVAEVPGESGNIPRGEQLSISIEIPSLVRAYASAAFSGGRSGALASDLKSTVMSSISTRGMSSPSSILAVLKDSVPSIDRVSVVGPYHTLMTRNRHGAGGIPLGGFEDVYVRTSRTIETKVVTATATRVSGLNYSVTVAASDYPGHYAVASVRPTGALSSGTFEISSVTKGVDPNWPGASSSYPLRTAEASFVALSRWQTSVVLFTAPQGSSYGAEFEVDIEVQGVPSIDEADDIVNNPERAQVSIDRLVKASVPCLVSVGRILVGLKTGADRSPVKAGINAAFSAEVSRSTSYGGVRAERLISAFMGVDGVDSLDVPLTLSGNVLAPTGETRTFSSRSLIKIFNEPDYGYGPDNTEFFPDPAGVLVDFTS